MHVLITYGFPVILILFELGIRRLIDVDNFNFIGPTLASAALCYLAALTKPKEIPGITTSSGEHITIKRSDNHLIAIIWILILVSLFFWELACVLSNQSTVDKITFWEHSIRTDFLIGLICYITSLIMTAIKEWL